MPARYKPSKVFRNFAVCSFVLLLISAIALTQFSYQVAMDNVISASEGHHMAVERIIINKLWSNYEELLISPDLQDAEMLRAHIKAQGIQEFLETELSGTAVIKIEIYNLIGQIIYSSEMNDVGINGSNNPDFLSARDGVVTSRLLSLDNTLLEKVSSQENNILSSFIPIRTDRGHADGVVAIYGDISHMTHRIDSFQNKLIIGVIIISCLLFIILLVFAFVTYIEIKSKNETIRNQSIIDSLTGLPNRALFIDSLAHALEWARNDRTLVALILFDIDHFKQINDLFGHDLGDVLLSNITKRFAKDIASNGILARLGGDEFAVLFENLSNLSEVSKNVTRIMNCTHEAFTLDGHDVYITVSMGIAMFPEDNDGLQGLLKAAGMAMSRVKEHGRNNYLFYSEEMNKDKARHFYDEKSLRLALERNEFKLVYQPKVNATTGVVSGAEALIRWDHPEHGIIPPVDFIRTLEKTGLITEVGEWVLREACRVNKKWQDSGMLAIKISVNASVEQFKGGKFVGAVQQILTETKLDPQYLEIEITESCLMDDVERIAGILNSLKDLGISIALDDFGTGYSSLSYLKRLPIDVLKIDRSFVANIDKQGQNDNAAIVTAIMALSHSLRLDVVAEGVETAQELAYLHALGCQIIQGFLFSRPLSEDEFTKLLEDSASLQDTLRLVRSELSERIAN